MGKNLEICFRDVARSVFDVGYGLSGMRWTNQRVSYDDEDHGYVE